MEQRRESRGRRGLPRPRMVARRILFSLLLVVSVVRSTVTPSSPGAWTIRTRTHLSLGQHRAALRASERGLDRVPSALHLAELRSSLLTEAGDQRGARHVWDTYLQAATEPREQRAAVLALLELGADELVREHLHRGTLGRLPDVPLLRAVLEVLDGQDVERALLVSVPADGEDAVLRSMLASRLLVAGAPDAAWYVITSSTADALPKKVRRKLVSALSTSPRLGDVCEWATDNRQRLPEAARSIAQEAALARGVADYRQRAADEALGWFRIAEGFGPRADLLLWRARAHRRAGDVAAAHRTASAAAEAAPGWVPAVVLLAETSQVLEGPGRSVELWRQVAASADASLRHLVKAGGRLAAAGELELASSVADRALRLEPTSPDALLLRAEISHTLGRVEEVTQAADALRRLRGVEAARAEVRVLARCGEPTTALERCRLLRPEDQDARLWLEVLQRVRRDGHLDIAARAATEAARRHPADHRIQEFVASSHSELRVVTGAWTSGISKRPVAATPGRVLHVVGRSHPYWLKGYTVRTQHIVRAQREIGLDAQVVTQLGFPWSIGHDVPDEELIDGVPHHRLRLPAGAPRPLHLAERLTLNAEALSGLVERLRPAVLHAASDFRNAAVALEVGEALGLPVVYEVRGFWEETWLAQQCEAAADRAWYRFRQEREMDAARRSDHCITLADPMRDHLVAHGVPAERISIVPNAVEPAAFADIARDEELAASLGFSPDEVVVGYVSSLNRYEGIDVLLAAIATARTRGARIRGLVVGDGDDRPRLERVAEELGLNDVVTFTGAVPHGAISSYYGLLDIFVVPRIDARVCRLVSPLKPYEAMAARRTVVVSGTPVLRTIVDDGITGATFTPEDPDDLAAKLCELAADAAARERMGAAAREHVISEHTWANNALRYHSIYERLGAL
jgi:glycosyltransferase involved in cell wall biosynthesis